MGNLSAIQDEHHDRIINDIADNIEAHPNALNPLTNQPYTLRERKWIRREALAEKYPLIFGGNTTSW